MAGGLFKGWFKGKTAADAEFERLAATPPPEGLTAKERKAFAEARRRIAACRNAGARDLDLNFLGLAALPPEIATLTNLTTLELGANKISDAGAAEIARLTNLTSLNLVGNQIGDAGAAEIARLTNLTSLDLAGSQIGDAGAAEIARLTNLTSLGLWGNEIGEAGAAEIARLTNLTSLNLGLNKIGDAGAAEIARLTNLTSLSLWGYKIGDAGAAEIARLTNLTRLYLDETRVTDLGFLEPLTKLKWLSLKGTRIKTGDPALLLRPALETLYLVEAAFLDAPRELLSQTHGDNCLPRLRDYYAARLAPSTAARPDLTLDDAKVMILGNGQVGKTQLRRHLEGAGYDATVPTTHGLEIAGAALPAAAGGARLRLWDFGGQDIYLGTHALFLKTRAIFVLAWTPAMEARRMYEVNGLFQKNYPLTEFARYVEAQAGGDFPVILVQAQCENPEDARDPDNLAAIAGRFSRLQKLHFAARTGENADGLAAALRTAAAQLRAKEGEKKIPASWGDVKAAIEDLAAAPGSPDKARTLTRAGFDSLCAKHDVTAGTDTLLDLLHHFGTLFYDADVNADLVVIDQTWALQAIYAVFDRTRGGAYHILRNRMFGRFTPADLDFLVWRGQYAREDQAVFLDMMRACGVAFILRPAREGEEALWLAPELLPPRGSVERELAVRWREGEGEALTWQDDYLFLAPATARELMRRIGADAGLNGLYWEDGFHFYDGALAAQAIVEIVRPQDHSWRGLIRIAAKGDGAAALLGRLQMLCGEVGERFGAIIDGEALAARIAAGADGVVDDPPADVYEDALRARLDRRLEAAPATFAPAPPPMPQERCFISYAHGGDADEAARQRQLAFEAVLKRLPELGLEPFYDIEHLAHGESIDSFMALGAEQPKLTLILSEKYLHSPYCMDELRRIWRACGSQAAKFRARVRVLALPDAKFQTDDDQENIRNHWREQAADSHQRIETRLKAGERAEAKHVNTYNAAIEVKDLVVEILSCVADTIHVRNLSEIDKLRF